MVDEVKIKVGMDTADVEPKMRSLRFNLKALQEDTELLKDLQLEYKQALAESGGRRTPKVLAAYKKVLELQADIAQDERNIDKRTKSFKAMQKPLKAIAKTFGMKGFLGLGAIGGALYGVSKYLSSAAEVTKEIRSSYLGSMATGMNFSEYTALASGSYIGGADKGNLTKVLSNINEGLLSFKTGIGDVSKLANLSNITGIALTDLNGNYKTSNQLLKDIQEWVKDKPEAEALHYLQGIGFTPDLIDAMKKGAIAQASQYKITEEQRRKAEEAERERRRREEEGGRFKRNITSSAPVIGFNMLVGDLLELGNVMMEGLPEDKRTDDQKKRDFAVNRIVELEKREKEYQKKRFVSKKGRGRISGKKAAEEARAEIAELRMILQTGDLDRLEIYGTAFEPEKGIKIKENAPKKKEPKVEVLNLNDSTVPEKIASVTGSNGKVVSVESTVNVTNNNYGDVDAEKVGEKTEKAGIGIESTVQKVASGGN